jgi:hypothetical protein
MYNSTLRGWIAYYSRFYRTQLSPILGDGLMDQAAASG